MAAAGKSYFGIEAVAIDEIRERWVILLIAFICVIIAFSLPAFAPQNIYDLLERDFGWTRTETVYLSSFKYITGSIVAIVVGGLIDKLGVKKVLVFVSSVGAIAVSSFYFIPNLSFYYFIGFLLGIAVTGTIVAVKVLISRAFDHAQGVAMGTCLAGMSIGQMLVPWFILWFLNEGEPFAWRAGMLELSLSIWLIAIPLLVFGLSEKRLTHSRKKANIHGEADVTIGQVLREGRFWLIGLAVFLVGFVDQAFIQNNRFILLSDIGISNEMYPKVMTVYAIAGILSRPILGAVIDRISVRGVSIAYVILAATSLLTLPLAATAPLLIYIFMMMRGISHSGIMLDSAMLSKQVYGPRNLGIIIGLLTGIINVGFAIGPPAMSALGEYVFGTVENPNYAPVFVIYAVLAIIAAGIVLLVKPTFWLAVQAEKESVRQ